ncbi:MAG: aspartate aminotransferase [Epulopiscium sp. Nele67-Bin001]|nr:MAG: aspartate aminotransferase [Epulopiscium sp. Nele67-Bin001]
MISEIAKNIAPSSTLAISAKAKELRGKGIPILGFGVGEPDFNTPEYINEAAKNAIENGFTKYTAAAGILPLREAIAKKLNEENKVSYTPEQIVVNSGAKHSLFNAFMAVLNPGDEVIIPAPYWLSYTEMVKIVGAVPKVVRPSKQNGYKLQADELKNAITTKTKAIIINSPSNPTGLVYSKEELKQLADIAISKDLWIISDEIYEYLVYEGTEHVCIASLSDEIYNHTIVINGFSKGFAMTGWRVGYTASPLEVAKAMSNIQSHAVSHPSSISQKAAEAALTGDRTSIHHMIAEFAKRRDYMYNGLCEIPGLDVLKPYGAFYCLVDVSGLYGKSYEGTIINNEATLAKLLLDVAEMAVVPCEDFGIPNCIRLSYAVGIDVIETGIARLKKLVSNLQ